MNIVAHMTECKPGSTIASARVARFIVNTLNEGVGDSDEDFILVDTLDKAIDAWKNFNEGLNVLFIVNGPMAFCDFLPELADLVRRASRVVWVQQDYTINPPAVHSEAVSPFRKVFADLKLRPIYWTTIKKNVVQPLDAYINWNQLTYDPKPFPEPIPVLPRLLYYGAFREKRLPAFQKYLVGADYQVVVSTTPLRAKKFLALDDNIVIAPPFTDLGNLPEVTCSLYIEDPKSGIEFHSPANRFYEMLSAGIPIFFDESSIPMLSEANIHVPIHWMVKNKADLYEHMTTIDMRDMRFQQREHWNLPYVAYLQERVQKIWHQLKEA